MGNPKIRDSIKKYRATQNGVGLEIGVWRGKSTRILYRKLKPKKFYLVDPYSYGSYSDVWGHNEQSMSKQVDKLVEDSYKLILDTYKTQISDGSVVVMRMKSEKALMQFKDEYFDWISIDGDHRYEAVKTDLTLSFRKLKHGGIIYGDDYIENNEHWGVYEAVNEFIEKNKSEITIFDIDKDSHQYIVIKR